MSDSSDWRVPAIFAFGVIFICAVLAVAIWIPNPTQFSKLVFGLVAALSAGGVAALIPGSFGIELPVGIKAAGGLGVFALVFYAFWQMPSSSDVVSDLPRGVETGWIFVGYVDKASGAFREGPYVSVTWTSQKMRDKFVEDGDKIKLNVARELIIKDYKNGGGNPLASPTTIPGGIVRPVDHTAITLPKSTEWIVRDAVVSGFSDSPRSANWVRIAAIPQ